MKRWIFFVARRLVRSGRSRGGGATGLATLGIAAGVATLVVVLAVMNGFQLGTIENILELNSFHLRLETEIALSDHTATAALIETLTGDGTVFRRGSAVTAAIPFTEIQTLARGYWPDSQGILLRAVPPDWLERDRGAAGQISVPIGSFDLETPGSIVLGTELSRALGVRVGDPVAVTHIPAGSSTPVEVQLRVSGLFQSGYLDFDRNWGFIALDTATEILDVRDPLVIGIKLADRFDVDQAEAELSRRMQSGAHGPLTLESWRSFNRGIFGALRMEKTMMVFLVGLIFVVVAGNIYQLLRRSILERSEEIAILRALGAGEKELRQVFLLEGWLIGIAGTATGLLAGLFISGNLNELFIILERLTSIMGQQGVRVFSPAYFYIEEIPRRIFPGELLAVSVGAIGASVTAAGVASASLIRLRPMDLLRNE